MPKINAHESALKDIFSSDYAFCIPDYQRPYRWEKEQATALLNDLLEASAGFEPDREDAKQSVTPYFLGSCVLIKQEAKPDAEVVDGQQRLTTLSLLFKAIRDNHADSDIKASMASRLFEKGNKAEGTKDRVRLRLRERDHAFYEKKVLNGNGTVAGVNVADLNDSQTQLVENSNVLSEKIRELTPERIATLATYINLHTYMVVVATPDLESAFRIFSVLNDRGMPLSAADILKAEIIGKIPERERKSYNDKWQDLEDDLSAEWFSDLFSHIRMIRLRKKLQATVLSELREEVKPAAEPRKFIDDELLPLGDAFGVAMRCNYESTDDAKSVNRYFGYLNRLGDRDWVPPAIAYLARYKSDTAKVLEFVKSLERLAMGLWLLQTDVNGRIERYATVIAEILAGQSPNLDLTEDEQKRIIEVLDGTIYELSPKPKRTAILLRLDESLTSGEASYVHDIITVEHVLPQTPDPASKWMEWWPDAVKRTADVHRLGNLALLNRRQNSAARNWEFDVKKTKYFQTRGGGSPFQITSDVLGRTEWTPDVFSARQTKFLSKLKEIWGLKSV